MLSALAEASFARQNSISLGIEQEQYAADPMLNEQSDQYSDFSLRHQYLDSGKSVAFGSDVVLQSSTGESSQFQMAIPELYSSVKIHDHLSFTVGRKLENWSELDRHFSLGLWQPLVRWDAAQPIDQGLTGVFIGMGPQSSRLQLFASRLYLPDQNPHFDVVDGKVVSDSRWFRAPVSQAELNYGESNIFYKINEPSVSDVVLNESYAAMYTVGDPTRGSFLRIAYADKPANQFHLGIDAEGIYLLDSGDLEPKIYPKVVRHKLYTIETGFHASRRDIVVSTTLERYQDPELPEGWEQTRLIDGNYFGAFWNESVSIRGMARTVVEMGYVQKTEETDPNVGTVIKGEISASTQRFAFEKLAVLGVQHDFFKSAKSRLGSGLRYVYSAGDDGEWISGNIEYSPDRDWTFALRFDVFGVPDQERIDQSFISTFRANDRVVGGFTYVF